MGACVCVLLEWRWQWANTATFAPGREISTIAIVAAKKSKCKIRRVTAPAIRRIDSRHRDRASAFTGHRTFDARLYLHVKLPFRRMRIYIGYVTWLMGKWECISSWKIGLHAVNKFIWKRERSLFFFFFSFKLAAVFISYARPNKRLIN